MQVEAKSLGHGFWRITWRVRKDSSTVGHVTMKKSKSHLCIWQDGWRELCKPNVTWQFVVKLVEAL